MGGWREGERSVLQTLSAFTRLYFTPTVSHQFIHSETFHSVSAWRGGVSRDLNKPRRHSDLMVLMRELLFKMVTRR